MGTVHQLLKAHGKQQTMLMHLERAEVEAAAAYMSDEKIGIGFLYSGWCQAALPHKRLADDAGWQITGEQVTLVVEPGMRPTAAGKPIPVGVPYGSRARLIMLYLQSEAIRTQSRNVELGKSLRNWLTRMGISPGGKSVAGVREQAERISRCRLTLQVNMGKKTGIVNQNIVDTAIFLDNADKNGQTTLFTETARLSEGFYEQLVRHSVPLDEAAIRAINNNSMALDIYAWLAYRLHVLEKPLPVSWLALKGQFGTGFGRLTNFRFKFSNSLALAMAVYPNAKVEATNHGLLLFPSKPPVAATKVPVGRMAAR